jgi:opacity protein-like surface antigen
MWLMHRRIRTIIVTMCLLAATSSAGNAQVASSPPPPAGSVPSWSFAVNPYVWLPTLSANLQANGPRGGTVSTSISAGIGDYISYINFTAMVGGVARYGRFSVMTDLVYMNASMTSSTSHLSTVNVGTGAIDIPRSQQVRTGTRMDTTIWSLAGGYTLLQGDWGNIDAVAGFRMLAIGSRTNFTLTKNIYTQSGTVALSRDGSDEIGTAYFNAIGGVTGRVNIPHSKFYLPFYADFGGGALPFTWQVYGGVAYSVTSWADVSAGYRYLRFESDSSTAVRDLSLGGAIVTANFRF